MKSETLWRDLTDREKLVYVAARIAFFLPVFVFILSSRILELWLAKPVADAIAILLALLPFYWVAAGRVRFATYVTYSIILAAAVFASEHFLIR